MVEIRVRQEYGEEILLGFAVPGYDASRWHESAKYNFVLTKDQALALAENLLAALTDIKHHVVISPEATVRES